MFKNWHICFSRLIITQAATNGWSEGVCEGKSGWFPSAYVQRRVVVLASTVMDSGPLT
jgi:hypothetical protein